MNEETHEQLENIIKRLEALENTIFSKGEETETQTETETGTSQDELEEIENFIKEK